MTNKKIIIIGSLPPPYIGPSVATSMILKSKLIKNFQLIHFDISDHRGLKNIGRLDIRNIGLAVKHFFELISLLIRKHPQVVYIPICQTVIGFLRDAVFIFSSRLFGASIIIHLRGSYFRTLYERSNLLIRFIIKYTLKLVSRVIVLGESLRYIFEGLVPSSRIAVVSNGIEDPFKNNFDRKKKKIKDSIKILYLSSLAKEKGYLDVIRSIPLVISKYQSVMFLFAGEYWNKKDEIFAKDYITDNKLANWVRHLGIITGEKKFELFFSSDIFVFPSYNEGQPIVLIEAMAAGLPIITTDTGAIREMVIDGENGFIIDKQSPEQIAEKIIYLIENHDIRKEMGWKSRERFLRHYTKDKFIGRLGEVFEEVLTR